MPLELANILKSAKNHDHFESVCDTVLPFVLCVSCVPLCWASRLGAVHVPTPAPDAQVPEKRVAIPDRHPIAN